MENDKSRVSLSLDNGIITEVDNYAKRMGINRSAAVSVLLNQQFMQQNTLDDIGKIMQMIDENKIK